jgi:hypothetical protein
MKKRGEDFMEIIRAIGQIRVSQRPAISMGLLGIVMLMGMITQSAFADESIRIFSWHENEINSVVF